MRKALIATGVILLFLVVTSLQSFASEICVCIDNKGNMKFSELGQCKPKQNLLCWNVEGPPGPQGAQGEPGEQGEQGPPGTCDELDCKRGVRVNDADGQHLGILLDKDGGTQDLQSVFIPPPINMPAHFVETGSGTPEMGTLRLGRTVYFEESDCPDSGVAYSEYTPDILYRLGAAPYTLNRYFFTSQPKIWGNVEVLSNLDSNGGCNNQWALRGQIYRATEIPKDDIPFNLPVALPLIYEW